MTNLIETERLILRPFKTDDVDEYFPIISDSDIRKYVPYASVFLKFSAFKLIESYTRGDFINDFYFVILDKNTKRILGSILAIRIGSMSLDISYLIGYAYRNRGYMTEALLGFIEYIYENTSKYQYLQFTIEDENMSSRYVVEKCGGKVYRRLSKSTVYRIYINRI